MKNRNERKIGDIEVLVNGEVVDTASLFIGRIYDGGTHSIMGSKNIASGIYPMTIEEISKMIKRNAEREYGLKGWRSYLSMFFDGPKIELNHVVEEEGANIEALKTFDGS
jgi:hypothetical protein|tara:strand:+ start:59 stop:388 length:330 start_codon:yes stop_codon:yes gene_type:complete